MIQLSEVRQTCLSFQALTVRSRAAVMDSILCLLRLAVPQSAFSGPGCRNKQINGGDGGGQSDLLPTAARPSIVTLQATRGSSQKAISSSEREIVSQSSANSSSKQPQVRGNSMHICDLINRRVKRLPGLPSEVRRTLLPRTRPTPLTPPPTESGCCRGGTGRLLCEATLAGSTPARARLLPPPLGRAGKYFCGPYC